MYPYTRTRNQLRAAFPLSPIEIIALFGTMRVDRRVSVTCLSVRSVWVVGTREEPEALREIAQRLLDGESEDLDRLKRRTCKKYGLRRMPSNPAILGVASEAERGRLARILRLKPVRSMSGINTVAVMTQPMPCPHGRCAYCPSVPGVPNSYTGLEPSAMRGLQNAYEPICQVSNRLEQLKTIGHFASKVELILQGGTFTAAPLDYQRMFVKGCLDAMTGVPSKTLKAAKVNAETSETRNVGITFETRPDYCDETTVDQMLDMGVTRVELGVQSVYDDVYHLVERGHTVADVVHATRRLKDAGLKVGYHIMLGLPGSNPERDVACFDQLFANPAFMPDMLKIYPCLVLKGTKIYDWWRENQYRPYTTAVAAELLVEVKQRLPPWVRIMRVQRDIPAPLIVAGVKKSNLRQLVLNRLGDQGLRCRCIRCREVGHRHLHGVEKPEPDAVDIVTREYEASDGREFFISAEVPLTEALIGYVRLRVPSHQAHRPEIASEDAAIIRALRVYGPLLHLGTHNVNAWQHRGYGQTLLSEAERVALDQEGRRTILVNSGLGVKEYFRRRGYSEVGSFMTKRLR
jgi:elongator complex protein 3